MYGKAYEPHIHHRSYARIDFDALQHNFDELKRRAGDGVRLMAIIKADAYSHGSVAVAKELQDKVDYYGVAVIEEAELLRDNGITKPILILSYTLPYQYPQLIDYDITQTISSYEDAFLLSEIARSSGRNAKVHIALDTGMTRIGFADNDESIKDIRRIYDLPNIEIEGLFSHYASADEKNKEDALKQTERFKSFIARLEENGVYIPLKHICNSAGIIDMDEHFDMVRMGIALYGLYPSEDVDKTKVELIPTMQVLSHIVHLKDVPAGIGVSYNHTFITDKPMKIATVGIGYADGYPRSLSNRSRVIIRGHYAPVIGRVCMDLLMVDVTDIPGVRVADSVVLLGHDGDCSITAEELGELAGSFNYEIVCSFKKRVARVYFKNSQQLDYTQIGG